MWYVFIVELGEEDDYDKFIQKGNMLFNVVYFRVLYVDFQFYIIFVDIQRIMVLSFSVLIIEILNDK